MKQKSFHIQRPSLIRLMDIRFHRLFICIILFNHKGAITPADWRPPGIDLLCYSVVLIKPLQKKNTETKNVTNKSVKKIFNSRKYIKINK